MKRRGSFMSKDLREEIGTDAEYSRCALMLFDGCGGRITREHSLIYAGKKIQEKWAIIPLCSRHHAVDEYQDAGTMVKERNVWVALNRATDDELLRMSKVVNYLRERDRLNQKFGVYLDPPIPETAIIGAVMPKKALVRRLSKEELFEREVRAFARTNGIEESEARETLIELV